MTKITMRAWRKMSVFEKHELCSKRVPVSEEVFIRTAKNTEDMEERKKCVQEYGYYANVTFFADGTVHKDRPGFVGMVRTIPAGEPPKKSLESIKHQRED